MKLESNYAIYIFFIGVMAMLTPTALMGQYADHRGRYVDSIETVLTSTTPPKGDDLLRAYRDLAWGYLQTDR